MAGDGGAVSEPIQREGSRMSAASATTLNTLPPLPDLLDRAGFRVRGNKRADCPSCPGHSRATVAFAGEVYFCHRCKRTGNRESLARELGLLATEHDHESVARRRKEAREAARLREVADRLRKSERRVLTLCRDNLLGLVALRRNAGGRLVALHAGGAERFRGETELAWDALRFVAGHEARASASYLVAAFASERDRAVFALHPEQRGAMVERVLDDGGVRADRGRWVELVL